jgi:glycosyltransferase involved in cell wall biosynthesis
MNIALLSEKYTPDIGGLAISTERLARLLTSAGHTVRVFAPTSNLPALDKRTLSSGGISVTRFGAHKRVDDTLVDWFELIVEEHRREPFDILHAYFLPQAGFVATYAGKYLNLPSVVSIRGNDIERAAFDPAKFSHVMYALTNASAVTTNASELAKKAKAFVDREIFLIPNGIDTTHFKPKERNDALAETLGLGVVRNGIPHTAESAGYHPTPRIPVIGFAGELREKKGLHSLFAGYTLLNKTHPATLLIVGEVREGEDKKTFDDFKITNYQLPITVTGSVPHKDMPTYYSLMGVFVHPSLRDGMPNAVLEAMACGVPVVSTPVGGILDVIKDRENGMLVPVNDVDALGQAIEMILTDELLRKKLSAAARRTIIENYRPEMELNANLEVYRKLM